MCINEVGDTVFMMTGENNNKNKAVVGSTINYVLRSRNTRQSTAGTRQKAGSAIDASARPGHRSPVPWQLATCVG